MYASIDDFNQKRRPMLAIAKQKERGLSRPNGVYLDQLGQDQRELLNHLRFISLRCRVSARADLFEACAVLSLSKSVAKDASAEVLMKCLGQALGKAPVLFRPCVQEISFDEAWLLHVTQMAAQKNWDSFAFLLRSRISSPECRNLASLFLRISEAFALD